VGSHKTRCRWRARGLPTSSFKFICVVSLSVSIADDIKTKPAICDVPEDPAFPLCAMKVKVGAVNF